MTQDKTITILPATEELQIPSYDEVPDTWVVSSVVSQINAGGLKRRSMLKLLVGSATAIGLNVLSWLPPMKLRRANAYYDSWDTCQNYYNQATVCVPTWWYFGEEVCDSSGQGWHHHNYGWGDGYDGAWYVQLNTCNSRNAWHWYGGGILTKCSDGHTYYWGWWGSWDSESICRTNWYI